MVPTKAGSVDLLTTYVDFVCVYTDKMRTLTFCYKSCIPQKMLNAFQYWLFLPGNRHDQKAIRDHLWTSPASQDNHRLSPALEASPLESRLYFQDVFFKQWGQENGKGGKKA